ALERPDAAEMLRDVEELEGRSFLRSYPGHSAVNFDALAFVTTPPFGRFASTSMPPQPFPVLTALITHVMPSLPSVAGRCITVPTQPPEAPPLSPTPPPPYPTSVTCLPLSACCAPVAPWSAPTITFMSGCAWSIVCAAFSAFAGL